jgi:hypothetical protein
MADLKSLSQGCSSLMLVGEPWMISSKVLVGVL